MTSVRARFFICNTAAFNHYHFLLRRKINFSPSLDRSSNRESKISSLLPLHSDNFSFIVLLPVNQWPVMTDERHGYSVLAFIRLFGRHTIPELWVTLMNPFCIFSNKTMRVLLRFMAFKQHFRLARTVLSSVVFHTCTT